MTRPEYVKPSQYYQFHFMFIGYKFKDKQTGNLLKKYQVWHSFRALAINMLHTNKVVSRFELVNNNGWENGKQLNPTT